MGGPCKELFKKMLTSHGIAWMTPESPLKITIGERESDPLTILRDHLSEEIPVTQREDFPLP